MKDEISSSDGATMRFMLVYKKTHSKKKNNTLDKLLARKKKPRGLFVVFAVVDLFCFLNKLFCYQVFPLYRHQMPAVLCKGKCSARKTPGCHQYNWQCSLTD